LYLPLFHTESVLYRVGEDTGDIPYIHPQEGNNMAPLRVAHPLFRVYFLYIWEMIIRALLHPSGRRISRQRRRA